MDLLVTYDIADTDGDGATRLRRVADICSKYGQRVQFSVFECRLSATRMARMKGEIEDAIDKERDSVLIYRFPGRIQDSTTRLGRDCEHGLGKPWIL
ncbi:MAG: CRISPR-associated endonuclease Cas2 [Gammaproteobacteria bacterium]|nr:CRISPR-associated endonuclease Cas2 [Gammaproteobacteria bacterium]